MDMNKIAKEAYEFLIENIIKDMYKGSILLYDENGEELIPGTLEHERICEIEAVKLRNGEYKIHVTDEDFGERYECDRCGKIFEKINYFQYRFNCKEELKTYQLCDKCYNKALIDLEIFFKKGE